MPENPSVSPLVIAGQEDVVLGFKALGFSVYPLKDTQEFKTILPEIIRGNIAVCLVQEEFYQAEFNQIQGYLHLPLPVFIPFAKAAKMDLLENIVKGIKLRATGVF